MTTERLTDSGTPGLAPEWREWVVENLLLGTEPEELEEVLCAAGVDAEVARAAVAAEAEDPYLVGCRRIGEQVLKLEGLLDVYSSLAEQSGAHQRLPRVDALTPEAFFEHYYFANRPVLLEGMMTDWPAMRSGSSGLLRQRLGGAGALSSTGPLPVCAQGPGLALTREPGTEGAALLEELRPPRGIVHPEHHRLGTTLWLEPAGALTPLHQDARNVLLAQVHGRRQVKLIPSFQLHRVYSTDGTFSPVDPSAPDLERFPDFARADVLDLELEPGQMLFLPVGWWHWMRALDDGAAVCFFAFDAPEPNVAWMVPGS
ncbi:cupin-like domain-containing protein [Archangium violaceum]|uniref:cupin-like domain-containing protein n=1 Tax=Archangium violaceum TaxID=83451 RepID=UPI00193B0C4C|nr:cupin-like domain-containing protein [Archangium violaceum]QRK09341.1 cupin-like domain-containing protein [Archangium violaceum]